MLYALLSLLICLLYCSLLLHYGGPDGQRACKLFGYCIFVLSTIIIIILIITHIYYYYYSTYIYMHTYICVYMLYNMYICFQTIGFCLFNVDIHIRSVLQALSPSKVDVDVAIRSPDDLPYLPYSIPL